MALLTANYPARSSSEDSADAVLAAWWRVLDAEDHWLTPRVFDLAVQETLSTVKEWMPSVAEFKEICWYAKAKLKQEAEDKARAALPPPAPPTVCRGFSRALWNHHFARGSLSMPGPTPETERGVKWPTDQEVDERVAELIAAGTLLHPDTAPLVHARDRVRVRWRDGTESDVQFREEDAAQRARSFVRRRVAQGDA